MNLVSPVRTALSWSSGKDSAWALHVLRDNRQVEIVRLMTTVNEMHERVAMHGVRDELLQLQADSLGLKLQRVRIPSPCSNEQYDAAMTKAVAELRANEIEQVAFGDILLQDVKQYREAQMHSADMATLFPLWGRNTQQLAREMISAGVNAIVTCVDPKVLDKSFAGRAFDMEMLNDLPSHVDPCGENGEFHTFVYGGPIFENELAVQVGEIVERDGFIFADVMPRQ